ncbi:polysaccharide pyruvyl transferase family protein, partial [Klebsiella pneumoniae]|uniref:polysaccharide pyruvyl transferase family protein n=1 Tax=Klebsiella pneumoniae TaxID=573 RepID=UPI003F525554
DLLLSGGGSLLQDTTSLRSLLYYLWVQRVAWRARKPVMYYAQGLGPLRRRLSRRLVAAAARRAAYITVR